MSFNVGYYNRREGEDRCGENPMELLRRQRTSLIIFWFFCDEFHVLSTSLRYFRRVQRRRWQVTGLWFLTGSVIIGSLGLQQPNMANIYLVRPVGHLMGIVMTSRIMVNSFCLVLSVSFFEWNNMKCTGMLKKATNFMNLCSICFHVVSFVLSNTKDTRIEPVVNK